MSLGKTLRTIGVAGLVVGIGLFVWSTSQETAPASTGSPDIAAYTLQDMTLTLVAIGTMFISLLTTVSGIYFKWREDRRADRELEARLKAVEGTSLDQQR